MFELGLFWKTEGAFRPWVLPMLWYNLGGGTHQLGNWYSGSPQSAKP